MCRKFLIMVSTVCVGAITFIGCGSTHEDKAVNSKEAVATSIKADSDTNAMSNGDEDTGEDEVSVAGWKINFEDSLVDHSLENAKAVLGYGEVETSNYKKEAGDGKVFCLIKLKLKKEDSSEVIDWSKLKLKDDKGAEYTRVEDEFISDLGMKRLPGTTLNFGENEGWICFEVDENAQKFTLEYPFEKEVYQYEFERKSE